VSNVIDALRAITYLPTDSLAPPFWTDDGRSGEGFIAVRNGIVDLETRRLQRHTPRFFTHHSLPYDFNPNAPEPKRWRKFLEELWGNDPSSVETLQELFGYVLGGGTEQQKLFLLVGPKRSGKGTIARVLTGLLGQHNVAGPTLNSLGSNFGMQPLIDKPLAIISDARLGGGNASVVVERLLSVSGEDSLTIDRKYRDPWTGRLPTRFIVISNELPSLGDSSGALTSRFVILVFRESFYGHENPKLTEELLQEAPALLNWSLVGLDRLIERGYFEMPKSARFALRQMEDLASPVAAFLRECCEIDPESREDVLDVWHAWHEWCNHENRHPGNSATFGRNLHAAAPLVEKHRRRDGDHVHYVYRGLRLR
jgi:putative DNA primase/helicase